MIDNLNTRFRIDAVEAPSTGAEIAALKQFSPVSLPEFYLEMIRKGSEFEILVDDKMYIRLWSASGCIEMNREYKIQSHLGSSLAIGDDEGGRALILIPNTAGYSEGLYLIGFGALSVKDGTYITKSLEDLLVNGTGAERIYNWWKL